MKVANLRSILCCLCLLESELGFPFFTRSLHITTALHTIVCAKNFQPRQTSINLRLVQAECAESGYVDLYNPVALEIDAVSSVVLLSQARKSN